MKGSLADVSSAHATGLKAAETSPATEATLTSKGGHKTRRKRTKKAKASDKHLRHFMSSVTVDGDTFSVGDSAYLRMTDDFDEDDFTEVEVCQMCGHAEPEEVPMLECNKCLLGYHITCLRPPLTNVPKVKLIQCMQWQAHATMGRQHAHSGLCPPNSIPC